MSNATPPGWYPDVNTPGTERWWDGTAWTGHARPTAVTQPSGLQPQAAHGSAGTTGTSARTVVMTVAGLVVVAVAVTGFLMLGGDGDDTPPGSGTGSSAPSTAGAADPKSSGSSGSSADPDDPEDSEDDPTVLVDQLNGVTLPVPDGWEKPEDTIEGDPTMRTVGSYACPGDSGSFCYHGTVTVHTANGTDLTDMKALAEDDIGTAADHAYEEDTVGDLIHGGITFHKDLASRSVTVAGRSGYLVRRQVTTGKGPGGYVESLVFPSAVGSETPVIVRFAFDAGQDALPLSLMDTITEGIRPIGDATSGGVGSSVAP
ncbi:DUF2510 domain-containing protein [Streptomyces sp. NBC_01012]|uniref:DUF2510 domain-containing protein n=1 Tax=Streptomyces sp. NBC_01012 TaxID=2903717 RepID=UPI00386F2751|nr:DUF2510 domain-containing protein [Streptomyces sp. NBC_01012]